MRAFSILGYAFDADTHCPECTRKALLRGALTRDAAHCYASKGSDEHGLPCDMVDSEGNIVYPMFLDGTEQTEYCGDCHEVIYNVEGDDDNET
jgi:hypothetical protein